MNILTAAGYIRKQNTVKYNMNIYIYSVYKHFTAREHIEKKVSSTKLSEKRHGSIVSPPKWFQLSHQSKSVFGGFC